MKNKYFSFTRLIVFCLFLPVTNAQVLTTVQENDRSVDAKLAEATSPLIPLVSASFQEKGKLQTYQSIVPFIVNLNISIDMVKKVVDRFILDVVDVMLNTTKITNLQLSDTSTTIKAIYDGLDAYLISLKNQSGTTIAAQRQIITTCRTTLLTKQQAMAAKIKTQNDFLTTLAQARNIPAAQFLSRINSYQNMLNQVSQTIGEDGRQEYLNDFSSIISYALKARRTPQDNTALKNLLDNATRLLPDKTDLFNSFRTALAQQDQQIPPGTSIFAITPTSQTFSSSTASSPFATTSASQGIGGQSSLSTPTGTTSLSSTLPSPSIPLSQPQVAQTQQQSTPIQSQVAPLQMPTTSTRPPLAPASTTVALARAPSAELPVAPRSSSKEPKARSSETGSTQVASTPKKPRGKAAVAKKPATASKTPAQKTASQKAATPKAPASKGLTKQQKEQAVLAALVKELPTIKANLEKATDFMQIIATCTRTITLLSAKIKPEEKLILKQLLAQRIPQLYNERANRTEQETGALATLLQTISKNKEVVALVSQKQLETATALAHITVALNKKNPVQQIASFNTAAQALTPNIDRYEKQLFMDGVATLFSARKTFTTAELAQVQKIFADLASKASRKKKIFNAAAYKQFETWEHITQSRLTLTAPTPQKTFRDLVILYQGTLPHISRPEASHEREVFIANTLPALFAHRGNVKLPEFKVLRTFFDKTVKTPNLLAANQVPTVMFWLQELTNAQSIATREKTYLESLIEKATASRNPATYSSALALFTQHTHTNTRKAFIVALNTLFSQRNTQPLVDKQQLISLLEEVGKKKLTPATLFLSPNQKMKLSEWQATLTAEMKQGK